MTLMTHQRRAVGTFV